MDVGDPKELVRRGYDVLSERYEWAFGGESKYGSWIEELLGRLPDAGTVLDIGCGNGVPVARSLVVAGHRVTGVDISEVQIRRARELVPCADFIRVDATMLELPQGSFDAVVCLYTLIHVPVEEQPTLLQRIASWLRPGGWFLSTTGHRAWTGTDENWLGGGAAMWWSHADAETNRAWLVQAGFDVVHEEFVPEGDSGHVLFWARRSLE
ncbi:class I SAM-dependent methyltransferase [Streptomyces monashensis]|uniref:Methyltransferase type 11 n=1 Tax=Streptomyces monashensis TaxID=1678012 RepID=A0A1S2Q1G4_9ACTN|nr:class I SAM-dependent methyltransferase [Streptomyces monashensis]OIJ99873.1 methyltransferase type 11 [Streptomyces monashensis]